MIISWSFEISHKFPETDSIGNMEIRKLGNYHWSEVEEMGGKSK